MKSKRSIELQTASRESRPAALCFAKMTCHVSFFIRPSLYRAVLGNEAVHPSVCPSVLLYNVEIIILPGA